ncbi:MAG: hypothetical protein P4M12_06640 [Gammaproteobacteria bacterium]|nr:hypothetical protein [Gammaproteobacteria bacterium]
MLNRKNGKDPDPRYAYTTDEADAKALDKRIESEKVQQQTCYAETANMLSQINDQCIYPKSSTQQVQCHNYFRLFSSRILMCKSLYPYSGSEKDRAQALHNLIVEESRTWNNKGSLSGSK